MDGAKRINIDDVLPDEGNANKGSTRGQEMVNTSVERLGAGRSILLDKNGKIVAGDKTLKAAKNAGVKEVIVIPSDGSVLVAVQRDDYDLSEEGGAAREMSHADNRTHEVSYVLDPSVLEADINAGSELDWQYEEYEIAFLLSSDSEERRALADEADALSDLLFGEAPEVEDVEPDEAPEAFQEYGEDIKTEYRCPKCAYEWSGAPR